MATSRETARAFIDQLRKDNGGLTREHRDYLLQNRPEILEIFDNNRRKLGISTRTLAEQLYAKDTRFLYELIQNAEDNKYTIAEISSEVPWLRFSLYQDRVEIDSNEDGFSESNIRAICSIGESTKTNAGGYIGEKGIGFKSVFKVAHKVHVQSGLFSFAFEHERDGDDTGLGMVTPLNELHYAIPEGVRTRITLYLLRSCDKVALREDFLALPETLLLFLKKLKKLSVRIFSAEDGLEEERDYSLSASGNRATIKKETSLSLPHESREYLITRRCVSDMPSDRARKGITDAEVVLAFPLDALNEPIVEDQHVFAFLPLRKVGYKFLIQSDFITQANREDVFDNPWNARLRDETSKAFIQSINGFLKHPKLRHQWVRYIPTDTIADDFWGGLRGQIFLSVLTRKAFFSRSNTRLMEPRQLRIVPSRYRDDSGLPLLPDLTDGENAYLSEEYDSDLDVPVLKKMKVPTMSIQDFLDRIQQDLESYGSCIQQSLPRLFDKSSHTKIADELISAIQVDQNCNFVQKLPIVPLSNWRWARPFKASIFWPTSGGIGVPVDLPLSLVNEDALHNKSWVELFGQLGVVNCHPTRVFPLIEQQYKSSDNTIEKSLAHVKFMFWHHQQLPPEGMCVWLASNNASRWFNPRDTTQGWVYCPHSQEAYSASSIFQATVPELLSDRMNFVDPSYYDLLQQLEVRNDRKGGEWFDHFFEIKEHVQLSSRMHSPAHFAPSHEIKFVIRHHAQHLLGVLKANWLRHEEEEAFDELIRSAKVPILCSDEPERLDSTYLPLPRLRATVRSLGLEDGFGFIQELENMADISFGGWSFLARFGVAMEEDVEFWLRLLERARKQDEIEPGNVFKIYEHLQKFVSPDEVGKIREAFQSDSLFVQEAPVDEGLGNWKWSSLKSCVWQGPDWFTYRIRLAASLRHGPLYSLFVCTLAIKDASVINFLDYLRSIQISGNGETSEKKKIPLLYRQLEKEAVEGDGETMLLIRSRFDRRKLVYDPQTQTWHSPLSCIWAKDRIRLPGKCSLATSYKGQGLFFTKFLGIRKPDLTMHVIALQQKAENGPDKMEMIEEILNICALNPTPDVLKKLEGCKCFPVRLKSDTVDWVDSSNDFKIVDRREYSEGFKGKVRMLDLSLEEVHDIKVFLDGMGLAERYLSKIVRSETTAENGSPYASLTEDMRKKSYAICRFAAHCGSRMIQRDAAAVLSILSSMKIYTSRDILKSLSVNQDSQQITIERPQAYVHLKEEDGQLELYVPKDKQRRQVCLMSELPETLLKHLGASIKRSGDLGAIITSANLFVVNKLLERGGIIEVRGIETPDDDRGYESDASDASDGGNTLIDDYTSISSEETATAAAREETNVTRASSTFRSSPFSGPGLDVGSYEKLLDVLIRQAAQLSRLPDSGRKIRAEYTDTNQFQLPYAAVTSAVAGERGKNIGAAGELFVFEILKALALPDFTLDRWKSTIRGRVSAHDNYRHVSNWTGVETADIVYRDRRSVLTGMLIDRGYLDGFSWSDRTPTYFIEVKSTLGPLEAPFFCSQLQVDRLNGMKLPARNLGSNNIYLIFRVFSLGSNSGTGLKIYLDPATLREKGELKFNADYYAVTPAFPSVLRGT